MEKEQAQKAALLLNESVPGVDPGEVEVIEDWVSSVRTYVVRFEASMLHGDALRIFLFVKDECRAEFVQIFPTEDQRLRVSIY